jgi:hypothetical protein
VSSEAPKPANQDEGNARAKAFERAYKESHPNGPYPTLEPKSKPEAKP